MLDHLIGSHFRVSDNGGVERAAGEFTRAKALPQESPDRRRQIATVWGPPASLSTSPGWKHGVAGFFQNRRGEMVGLSQQLRTNLPTGDDRAFK